jgi:hypothetical protein
VSHYEFMMMHAHRNEFMMMHNYRNEFMMMITMMYDNVDNTIHV